MLYQITSGRGPVECKLAVGLYLASLLNQNPRAVTHEESIYDSLLIEGKPITLYHSAIVEMPDGITIKEGIIKWICPSPIRKGHRRKNWFIKVSRIADDASASMADYDLSDKKQLRIDTFRSPGKGGQNVNKVETGVRITHLPSNLSVASVTARTQLANKKIAFQRLQAMIAKKMDSERGEREAAKWNTHNELERGSAIATFSGLNFQPLSGENGNEY